MPTLLTFEAASEGVPYGVIVLDSGVATAHVGSETLTGALLGHAVMWMRERSPRPDCPVRFYIVGYGEDRGPVS
jgi:hypothetical protein